MCKLTISCPLCSHSSFSSIGSLRTSLIKSIDSPIKCPVCHDIVIGLDKLTLHLISHNKIINMTNNNNGNIDYNCNIDNNSNNNNSNNLNGNNQSSNITAQFELSDNKILINTNKNQQLQQQLQHLQQMQHQQKQQHQIIQNQINQNVNDNLNINNSTHAFYYKNEPIKFITPIVLTPDFLHNTGISTLTSTASSSSTSSLSSSSSTSALTLLSRESNMIPTICSNLTQANCSNQIQHQQQQQQSLTQHQQNQNLFNSGTTVLHIKPSSDNNLQNNLIIIENDNNCNNLIKIEDNGNLDKNDCTNYNKIYLNTQIIKDQHTQYSDEHRCDICGIKFTSVEVFKKHVQIIHQIPFDTNEPKLQTIQTTKINNNLLNNGGQTLLYQCNFCSKSYKIKARLRLHLKVKHCLNIGTDKNNNSNGIEENCDSSNIATKLKINEKIRTLTTNLNATNSNENFDGSSTIKLEPIDSSNQNLLEHQKIKVESIPKPWKCDICSKFYTTKYFLKKHKRIHTGETPYKCNICNKSFTFQQSYHKHLLYHSDDKPHVCKICNRAFKELSTLHNHERIHSGEKPFECEICGKRFRQRVSNYVHQRTHTGAKPYSCEMCFRKFRYKVTLRTHKCSTNLFETFNKAEQNYKDESNIENIDYTINKKIKTETNLSKTNTDFKSLCSTDETIINLENNLQKILQNVDILPNAENLLLSNTNSNNIICNNNNNDAFKKDENDLNKERVNKSLDEFVAESCNKLGIGNYNGIDNNQNNNNNCLTLANDTPSPSEQLQHLCLYSPNSIERNLNINDDSLKQLFFEIDNVKPS